MELFTLHIYTINLITILCIYLEVYSMCTWTMLTLLELLLLLKFLTGKKSRSNVPPQKKKKSLGSLCQKVKKNVVSKGDEKSFQ